jgi:hypothetical protein
MKTFRCVCGNTLYFENTGCLACGRTLGFLPDHGVMTALEPAAEAGWRALHPAAGNRVYRMCKNYKEESVCNWMVSADEPQSLCRACRLNHIIPNLSEERNRVLWYRIEVAKRRLLYTLYALGLPVVGRDEEPDSGLVFEFLSDPEDAHGFSAEVGQNRRVLTGHHSGLITINVAEADSSAREGMREKMNELYRTLLGHFRHEVGHYYWDRLVRGTGWIENFRSLFGDDRRNYDEALQRYYANGAPPDWRQSFVSAYATAHPWEDWAETWAHHLHMVDTLETAHDFGFAIQGRPLLPPAAALREQQQLASVSEATGTSFEEIISDWGALTVALNAVNRSMGLPDAYPFVLSPRTVEKLRFVHQVITGAIARS